MRNAFIDVITEACRTRDDIMVLSGDAGLGVFDQFKQDHPDRFRNMGVAEQNAVSFAAGLALTGFKVVLYNLVPFLLYRPYEQVRNDICYQELPVILAGIGSGITYAPQGMSHYAVEDIGIARTLPNLVTLSPADPVEARASARYALASDKPVYVRLAKRGEPNLHEREPVDVSVPQVICPGSEAAIVFHGSISSAVMAGQALLRERGLCPLVVSVPMVQPLNADVLLELLSGVRHVVSVEEQYADCGLGSMISRIKAERQVPWSLTVLGIAPRFIHEVGNTDVLRSACGISAADIAAAANAGT